MCKELNDHVLPIAIRMIGTISDFKDAINKATFNSQISTLIYMEAELRRDYEKSEDLEAAALDITEIEIKWLEDRLPIIEHIVCMQLDILETCTEDLKILNCHS